MPRKGHDMTTGTFILAAIVTATVVFTAWLRAVGRLVERL